VSIRGIVERLAKITGSHVQPLFGVLPDRPGENEIAANTSTAVELLGWRATTSLDTGLSQTVVWFKKQAASDQGPLLTLID
jgi:nucleoside-diphosphate-sugar epimerase